MLQREDVVVNDDIVASWQLGPVLLWQLSHVPGTRGEPQARQVLGPALGLAPADVPILRDARGRPQLQGDWAGHDAGWSHSGGHLLVALGQGMRLGVDLERIQSRPRMKEVIARFFHPSEVDWLLGMDEAARQHWFFRVWCAKEALLKAHGHGISFGLHRFAFASRNDALALVVCDPELGCVTDWQLHEWTVGPDFRAALAWQALPACDNAGHEHPYPPR